LSTNNDLGTYTYGGLTRMAFEYVGGQTGRQVQRELTFMHRWI